MAQAQPSTLTKEQVWRKIKQFDSLVSQGHVSYKRVITTNGKSESYKHDLTYASDGRYAEEVVLPGQSGTSTKTVFDGTDTFALTGKNLSVSSGLSLGIRPSLFWVIQVMPRPSLPMGRGLTGLKNPQISLNGRWATVKGGLEDGTSLAAQVDTRDHFLVRKATRFDAAGNPIGVTTTMGNLNGGLSAAKAIYKWENTVETTSFVVTGFTPSAASTFQFRIRGSYTILDQRLGSVIGIDKVSSREMSKGELLQITRAALQKQIQEQVETASVERTQWVMNIGLLLLPVSLLGVALFFRRAKKRKMTKTNHEKSVG